MVLTADQKEKTAYHEAGHAIVGMNLPKCDPVYKATIIPRGGALGMVVSLPEMDRLNMHKDEGKQKIAMTMAGKAAEIIKYGEEGVSSGPVGDIQQAVPSGACDGDALGHVGQDRQHRLCRGA